MSSVTKGPDHRRSAARRVRAAIVPQRRGAIVAPRREAMNAARARSARSAKIGS